jgi:4-oxalocrotonate tautomerase
MPLVQIKLIEDELTQEQSKELIEKVTDLMVSFSGERLREVTWVVIEEVKSGHWGVGGKAVGLADVRAMQASED